MARYVAIGVCALASLSLAGCENKVQEGVRAALIDGASAQFKDVKACPKDPNVYTGEVNSKNRMGAYVGFEGFFYDGVTTAFAGGKDFMPMMRRCYGPIPGEPEVNPALGSWEPHESTNPIDDSKILTASLDSSEGVSSSGSAVTLVVRCQSKKTEIFVNWHDYLGDDSNDVYNDWKRVIVRVGSEEAATQRWGISTDSTATFAPAGAPLAKKMLKADRLVLQTTPYNESPVTAVFQLKGVELAMKPIAQACGWAP